MQFIKQSMLNITIVVGLPASGKTTLASSIGVQVVDDPACLSDVLGFEEDFIITDPYFCIKGNHNNCVKFLNENYNCVINTIYFKNDYKQCLKNAKLRPNKKVEGLIEILSKTYNPPDNALDVYKA